MTLLYKTCVVVFAFFKHVHDSEPAGQDLFALPAPFGAALPEPEAVVGAAARLQPRPGSQRESLPLARWFFFFSSNLAPIVTRVKT